MGSHPLSAALGEPRPGGLGVDGPYFMDARHCLYAGWVMGIASKHGFNLRAIVDDDGRITNRVTISLLPYAELQLVIPYPPEDWPLGVEEL